MHYANGAFNERMAQVAAVQMNQSERISTFGALRVRDFRLYFLGQICSISGNNAQSVGMGWLVLELTKSPTALGIVTALQFLPLLVLAPILGSIPDRFPKRRVLIYTQVLALAIALALWALAIDGSATPINIGVLALFLGVVNAIDNPARQSFIRDLVGPELLPNALGLNNMLMGAARIAGPAIAAAIITTAGIAYCFVFNALTFLAMTAALLAIGSRGEKSLRSNTDTSFTSGLRYVASTPDVRDGLVLMAIVGTFTYEFWVTLPVLTKDTFHLGSSAYGLLMSVMSAGSVLGGVVVARKSQKVRGMGFAATLTFGLATLLVGISPTFELALIAAFAMGATYSAFVAVNSASIQHHLDSRFRGRVMGLWTAAFMGSTAIGGPLMGWIAKEHGASASLILGGTAAVLGAFWLGRKQWLSTAS